MSRSVLVVCALLLVGCGERAKAPQPAESSAAMPAAEGTREPTEPPMCPVADSTVGAVLAVAARASVPDTFAVHSPDDLDAPGSHGECTLPRPIELQLASQYTRVPQDSGPHIFLVARVAQLPAYGVYALRVPGMYDPSRIDLVIVTTDGHLAGPPVTIAESWGDAGEIFRMRSWIFDVDGDGNKDVVRHTCQTYQEPGEDTATVQVEHDDLDLILWEGDHFAAPRPAPDSLRARYAFGAESCSA